MILHSIPIFAGILIGQTCHPRTSFRGALIQILITAPIFAGLAWLNGEF